MKISIDFSSEELYLMNREREINLSHKKREEKMNHLIEIKRNMIQKFNESIDLIEKKEILKYIENIEILIKFENNEI